MREIKRVGIVGMLLSLTLEPFALCVAPAEPSVVGMTYAKAKEAASSAGVTAKVATTSGSIVQQDDCLVISQVFRHAIMTGLTTIPSQLFLSLSCYGSVATAGKAGPSAASPEGQAAVKKQKALEWRESPDGQAWCATAQVQHPDWFPIEGCPS